MTTYLSLNLLLLLLLGTLRCLHLLVLERRKDLGQETWTLGPLLRLSLSGLCLNKSQKSLNINNLNITYRLSLVLRGLLSRSRLSGRLRRFSNGCSRVLKDRYSDIKSQHTNVRI